MRALLTPSRFATCPLLGGLIFFIKFASALGRTTNTDHHTILMEELKTCLYESHVALGAQMSPFGGFIMPIQYSTITNEHLAVRGHVGMFDVSHMGEIFVSGPDALKFVNHIFTNDISAMQSGHILYGMMLYPSGGVVDDLLVYREAEPNHYLLVVNAANIAKDYDWILEQSKDYDVTLDNASSKWGQIAVQGPDAEKTLVEVLGLSEAPSLEFYTFAERLWNGQRMIVSRTGYTGEDGYEIYCSCSEIVGIWDRLLKEGVAPCGLGCRDTLRFEAGLPLYGHELSSQISPIEAGLGMFVKLAKDEFIGKEACAKQKAEGVSRKIVGIELEDKAIPRGGYDVLNMEGEKIGTVTTGYHSISLDKSICMALVDSRYMALDTPLQIQIRKKIFPGRVVKKRFYTPNYKK